jgi:prepilin-type N-terminal cleavage/methylation domain-containing protein
MFLFSNLQSGSKKSKARFGFTLLEVAVSLVILGVLATSVLTIMNECIEAAIEQGSRQRAFEIARENMERILAWPYVQELNDYGSDEENADIQWETVIEPFYEPVTNRMWIRAVCSSSFTTREGEREEINLANWITSLSEQQIKNILDQKKREQEFLEELNDYSLADYSADELLSLVERAQSAGDSETARSAAEALYWYYPNSGEANVLPDVAPDVSPPETEPEPTKPPDVYEPPDDWQGKEEDGIADGDDGSDNRDQDDNSICGLTPEEFIEMLFSDFEKAIQFIENCEDLN